MTIENTTKLLRLNLQHFADDEQGEGDDDKQGGQDEYKEPEKVSLTQAELDDMIAKRLAREKAKYADYDVIKAKADEFEAERERIERENLSETERIKADLEAAQAEKQAITEQHTALQAQVEAQRIKSAFVRKATESGIKYTDAAAKLSDLSALTIGEDGELVGIDDVLNALITENPFLVEPEEKKPKFIGGGSDAGGEHVEKTKDQLLKDAEEKARRSNLPKDRAAYAKLKRELNK